MRRKRVRQPLIDTGHRRVRDQFLKRPHGGGPAIPAAALDSASLIAIHGINAEEDDACAGHLDLVGVDYGCRAGDDRLLGAGRGAQGKTDAKKAHNQAKHGPLLPDRAYRSHTISMLALEGDGE